MQFKKRDDNLIPILIAIVALISLAVWYNYLGDYTIHKVDAALGIKNEFRITNIVIEKGYNTNSGLRTPEIIISYNATKEVASYIKVENIESDSSLGRGFSKTIELSRDYFGKNITIQILANDETGQSVVVERQISLPQNIEPTIAIIST